MGAPIGLPSECSEGEYRPRRAVLCTIPQISMVGTLVVDFMNGNVTRWNEMTRGLVRNKPGELQLMDLENMLRMIDQVALTRDGMQFNTQQGRRWINHIFQTQLREVEQKLRATMSLAWTSSTGGVRVRGNIPESLVNRLGPLETETGTAAPVAPSSDVRERLGTAPLLRRQPLESRLGRLVDQNQTRSQTVSRTGDPATTATPAVTANQSTSAMPVEGVEPSCVMFWNRPYPSG